MGEAVLQVREHEEGIFVFFPFLFSILKAAIDTDDYFTLAWLFLPPFHRGRNSRKEM